MECQPWTVEPLMGDRANVIILQGNSDHPVVIYSHWGGTTLESGALTEAVKSANTRIGDPHYFTAMLIADLIRRDLVSGVGTSLDDNEHPIMVVNAIDSAQSTLTEQGARELLAGFRATEGV